MGDQITKMSFSSHDGCFDCASSKWLTVVGLVA